MILWAFEFNDPLIRGNKGMHTATASWTTKYLQPNYLYCSRSSNPRSLIGAHHSMHNHCNLGLVQAYIFHVFMEHSLNVPCVL